MDFETARQVLLVGSLEEADAAGEVVPQDLRRRAGDSAPEPGEPVGEGSRFTPGEETFLAARAGVVIGGLGDRGGLHHAGAASAALRFGGGALVVVLLLAGYFSKELGPSGEVNILAFPLLGVMAWNVVIYVAMVVRKVLGKGGGGVAVHWVSNYLETKLRRAHGDGMARFAGRWSRVAGPVFGSRASAWLHLGAAALGSGAVAAMYWQGVVRDYEATWESTFLSADAVRGLLSVALAPATWAPGLALPDVAGIEALRAPGGERAADWIHRYALAAAVVVIVPRLVLATLSGLRARRLSEDLDVRGEAPNYFKTLLAEKRGTKSVVRVVPHRIELEPKQRDALRAALHEHWGGALWLEFLATVAYGDEEDFAARADELADSDHIAVVAGLGSTPEDESQGRLLRAVRAAAGDGEVLLALDEGGFAERYGEKRAAERRAAWQKLADAAGVKLLAPHAG